METFGAIVRYLQQSEKLIVVTVVVSIAGVAAFFAERTGYLDPTELPKWTRPLMIIIWIFAVVHVAVRTAMTGGPILLRAGAYCYGIPARRRQTRANAPMFDHLNHIDGLAREVLCYARFRGKDHFWTDAGRDARWLTQLKKAGLVELMDADFGNAHYRIHPVAWNHMQRYPDRFLHVLAWSDAPWAVKRMNEEIVDRRIIEERSNGKTAGR